MGTPAFLLPPPSVHMPNYTTPYPQGPSGLTVISGWAVLSPGWGPLPRMRGWAGPLTHPHGPSQLEEEKAALLGQQKRVEQEATLAREEQERLEQMRLEQEVDRQGLEGSLRAAEQAREALEHQVPMLRQERCRLQEQLAQVGVRGARAAGAAGVLGCQSPRTVVG